MPEPSHVTGNPCPENHSINTVMSVNRSAAYSRKQLRSAYGNLMPEIHVLSSFGPQHAILLEKTLPASMLLYEYRNVYKDHTGIS
jgi:hypothetical protein